jgi:hypothetical protein
MMKKTPDWAEKYFARQDEEIRKIIIDNFEGKIKCILTTTDPVVEIVYALMFMVR